MGKPVAKSKWRNPQTAPKDALFLADVGDPYAAVCAWNERLQKFVYANFQIEAIYPEPDAYFETETVDTLRGWMPLTGVAS